MSPNWYKTYTHTPKAPFKNSSCGTDDAIDVPGPYREYAVQKNVVEDLILINISKMVPLSSPQVLPTGVDNNISNFSMNNVYGGFYCPTSPLNPP